MEKSHEYLFLIFLILIGLFFYQLIAYFSPYIGKAMHAETYVRIDPGIRVLAFTFDGSTTDFLYYDDVALETIENTTLERTPSGKIVFDGLINLAQDADVNRVVDLDSNVNISFNWIQINVTRLTSLTGSAVLSLYNLTFTNPRVLMGKNPCPLSICQPISYYKGTFRFAVSQFTMEGYSVEETPPPPPEAPVPKSGGGGGGGGGAPTLPINMSKKVLLELDAKPSQTMFAGDEIAVVVKLKNKGDLALLNTVISTITNAADVSLSLSNDFFDRLDVGEEDSLILKIKSLVKPIAHIGINNYFVTINADVGNYVYTASIRFFVNIMERDYETRLETLKQLQFADKFFNQTPECSDIAAEMEQAYAYYEVSEYNRSLTTIDSAMQECRDKTGKTEGGSVIKPAPKGSEIPLLLIEIIILSLLLIAILAYYTWKKGKKAETYKEVPGYYKATPFEKERSDLKSRFDSIFIATDSFIKKGDIPNAKKNYIRLHRMYNTLRDSSLSDPAKLDCYHKLSDIYSNLHNILRK